MTSVAMLFDNFGPYHLARLRAAAGVCQLLAIEVAPSSREYAWENDPSVQSFRRVVLVERGTSADVSRAELSRRVKSVLEETKPDVVAVPGWVGPAALGAIEWCARQRVPMIGMSETTENDEPRVAWKEWAKKKIVALFSAALVGGSLHRDYLVKLGMSPDLISFGYDAVDNSYFHSEAAKVRARGEQVRKEYALPENYFLASARFIEKKNLPRLLEAFSLYRSRRGPSASWSLVLLGDGPLRSVLAGRIAALGLSAHVLVPGFRQYADLPAYYALASAFIHVSTVEPWGLVVNEAMASGLPVLVSNRCGCARDLVREGKNGFTFDPLNVEEIAQRMVDVTAAKSQLSAFGEASQEIIADWSPQRFAHGLSQAIGQATARPPTLPAWSDRALLEVLKRW